MQARPRAFVHGSRQLLTGTSGMQSWRCCWVYAFGPLGRLPVPKHDRAVGARVPIAGVCAGFDSPVLVDAGERVCRCNLKLAQ